MRLSKLLLVTALASALSACGNSTAPRSPLAGRWVAILSSESEMSLELSVADTTVTGTGQLTGSGSVPVPLTVSGRVASADVRLSINTPLVNIRFEGALSGSTLAGAFSSAGYINYHVIFTKCGGTCP